MTTGGFGVNGLAYVYSINIISPTTSNHLWESDLIYSNSGIKQTKYDMYSYHITNNGIHTYIEDRLDREIYDSIDFDVILVDYLDSSYLRNSKIEKILG